MKVLYCDICGKPINEIKYWLRLTKKENSEYTKNFVTEKIVGTLDLCEECAKKYKVEIEMARGPQNERSKQSPLAIVTPKEIPTRIHRYRYKRRKEK